MVAELTDAEIIAELSKTIAKPVAFVKTFFPIESARFNLFYDNSQEQWFCQATIPSNVADGPMAESIMFKVSEAMSEDAQTAGTLLIGRLYLLAIEKL